MATIRYSDLLFTNICGKIFVLEENVNNIPGIKKSGVGVDGSSVGGYAGVSHSDVLLMPDGEPMKLTVPTDAVKAADEAFRGLSVEERLAKAVEMISNEKIKPDVTDAYWCRIVKGDGSPHMCDPRQVLRSVVEKAKAMGYTSEMFAELEFYLFKEGTLEPVDNGHYLSLPPEDAALDYRRELCRIIMDAGVKVRRLHHECGPAQNEIELWLSPVEKNADDTLFTMWMSKLLAKKYGWDANHEPKPLGGHIPGSGLHHHVLLRDLAGKNAFANEDGTLNECCFQFVAGMLKYARDICAVFARSTQTFQRLVPGIEAPVYCNWGYAARNCLVRVPTLGKGYSTNCRVEFRAGDSSGSPHLLAAFILAAGLKGIEDKLTIPPECTDDLTDESAAEKGIDHLPRSLEECVEILKTSAFIKETIGEDAIASLIKTLPLEDSASGKRKRPAQTPKSVKKVKTD